MQKNNGKNHYIIRYRSVLPTGRIDLAVKKNAIFAKTKQHAVEVLKSELSDHMAGRIRIDSVEQINEEKKPVGRTRKRSLFGKLAFGLFVFTVASRFVVKMLS